MKSPWHINPTFFSISGVREFNFGFSVYIPDTGDNTFSAIDALVRNVNSSIPQEPCLDWVTIVVRDESGALDRYARTTETVAGNTPVKGMVLRPTPVLFYPLPEAFGFICNGTPYRVPLLNVIVPPANEVEIKLYREFHRELKKRNKEQGWKTPDALLWLAKHNLTGVEEGLGGDDEVRAPVKAPRDLAHPVTDSHLVRVPNDPASILFASGIMMPSAWRTNDNECHKYLQNGKAIVTYRPDEEISDTWYDFRERALQTLESRFASMKGELVADVADILFWHWLNNDRPTYAGITLAQILEYRGVKARPNVIEEHWQAMRDVRAIRLRGGGIESEALFHISAAQPELFGESEPPKLQTVYRYHPGYFLSEAIQNDAFFLAYYARSVWQLDYYRDANAKKLARVLRVDWRRNLKSYLPDGPPRYRTWGALLKDAGIDATKGKAITHPITFIESIEKELGKLYVTSKFIGVCKDEIYHPEDRAKRANLPRKGALMAWLKLRTHITPADDIAEAIKKQEVNRLALVARSKTLAEKATKTRKPKKKAA
jgi:hypothetical protein